MSVVEGKQRICCFLVFADHWGSIVGLANGSAWGSLAIRERSTLCPFRVGPSVKSAFREILLGSNGRRLMGWLQFGVL